MAHFEIKNLSFYYPAAPKKAALDDISLTIEQGEYVTVCGRSGSGKTTLLKHLKSVLTPHGKVKGEIYFQGKLLKDVDLRTQSSKIGYVMQNPDNQIVTDKVWHELAFGLESLGYDQNTIRLRVAEMASYFGIQDWFHKNVSELSGGQKQLLNLASIMAMQPSVLILDEPTSQLDPIAASDFLNTVRKINRELRTTIIITEHRLEDIFYASDRVVVVENGKLIANDRPEKIGEFLKGENNLVESISLNSSAMVMSKEYFMFIGGFEDFFAGHGGEDYNFIHQLCANNPHSIRNLDYYDDFKTPFIANAKGFRLYMAYYSLPNFFKNLILIHRWHPRPLNNNFYSQRVKNENLLQEKMKAFDLKFKGQIWKSTEPMPKIRDFIIALMQNYNYDPKKYPGFFSYADGVKPIKRPLSNKIRKLITRPREFFKDIKFIGKLKMNMPTLFSKITKPLRRFVL